MTCRSYMYSLESSPFYVLGLFGEDQMACPLQKGSLRFFMDQVHTESLGVLNINDEYDDADKTRALSVSNMQFRQGGPTQALQQPLPSNPNSFENSSQEATRALSTSDFQQLQSQTKSLPSQDLFTQDTDSTRALSNGGVQTSPQHLSPFSYAPSQPQSPPQGFTNPSSQAPFPNSAAIPNHPSQSSFPSYSTPQSAQSYSTPSPYQIPQPTYTPPSPAESSPHPTYQTPPVSQNYVSQSTYPQPSPKPPSPNVPGFQVPPNSLKSTQALDFDQLNSPSNLPQSSPLSTIPSPSQSPQVGGQINRQIPSSSPHTPPQESAPPPTFSSSELTQAHIDSKALMDALGVAQSEAKSERIMAERNDELNTQSKGTHRLVIWGGIGGGALFLVLFLVIAPYLNNLDPQSALKSLNVQPFQATPPEGTSQVDFQKSIAIIGNLGMWTHKGELDDHRFPIPETQLSKNQYEAAYIPALTSLLKGSHPSEPIDIVIDQYLSLKDLCLISESISEANYSPLFFAVQAPQDQKYYSFRYECIPNQMNVQQDSLKITFKKRIFQLVYQLNGKTYTEQIPKTKFRKFRAKLKRIHKRNPALYSVNLASKSSVPLSELFPIALLAYEIFYEQSRSPLVFSIE